MSSGKAGGKLTEVTFCSMFVNSYYLGLLGSKQKVTLVFKKLIWIGSDS